MTKSNSGPLLALPFYFLAAIWIAHLLFGHRFIESMYRGESFSFLNRIISGRGVYPVEYYLDLAEWRLVLVSLVILVVYFLGLAFVRSAQTIVAKFGVLIFVLLASLVLLEGILVFFLVVPATLRFCPRSLHEHIRSLYLRYDRELIQAMPECVRYDPELTYTLRPGTCTFLGREFKTDYHINQLGLRDDEDSLVAPEVIILGDSYAMGWGVEQDETFAQILEREKGLRVLNAGISSYGTAREMRLLDRIDTSRLRYLVVQYSANDAKENESFYNNRNQLRFVTEEAFETRGKSRRKQDAYVPAKYAIKTLEVLYKNLVFSTPRNSRSRQAFEARYGQELSEAKMFLHAFMNSGNTDLSGLKLIVLDSQGAEPGRRFIKALRDLISSETYPRYVQNLTLLDVSTVLDPDRHFFVLDDHFNAHGHRAVAGALKPLLFPLPEEGSQRSDGQDLAR